LGRAERLAFINGFKDDMTPHLTMITEKLRDDLDVIDQLKIIDPRDYFEKSMFQKNARIIDSDPNHAWEKDPHDYYFFDKNDIGTFCISELKDSGKSSLLLAYKSIYQESTKSKSVTLSSEHISAIASIIRIIKDYFPPELKCSYYDNIFDMVGSIDDDDAAVAAYAILALDMLLDKHDSSEYQYEALPSVDNPKTDPSEKQIAIFKEFMGKMARKISDNDMREYLKKLYRFTIPGQIDIYGINFKHLFVDGLFYVITHRGDLKYTDNEYKLMHFPVDKLIKHSISSIEQLADILATFKTKKAPKIPIEAQQSTVAEYVNLEQVVGGVTVEEWSNISNSPGRGMYNVYEFTKGFQSGEIDINGKNEPIQLYEIDGDFFVGGDGRHRIAALKALGVPFIPALVIHYSQ